MNEYIIRLKRFIYRDFDPVTKSLLVLAGLEFLLSLLLSGIFFFNLNQWLILHPGTVFRFPWTLITYPLVDVSPLSLLFAILWLWFIGGSLERTWGSRKYGHFLMIATFVTGLLMAGLGVLFQIPAPLFGLWLPLVGVTWAWADLNPYQEMLFWGVIPLKAKWLAWINAIFIFLTYLQYSRNLLFNCLFGLASLSGIAVAYFFKGGISYGGGGSSSRSYRDAAARRARRSRFRVIK
jgi:membrane associated rhomboid family serine protease